MKKKRNKPNMEQSLFVFFHLGLRILNKIDRNPILECLFREIYECASHFNELEAFGGKDKIMCSFSL
jgi:hypothetical protein